MQNDYVGTINLNKSKVRENYKQFKKGEKLEVVQNKREFAGLATYI